MVRLRSERWYSSDGQSRSRQRVASNVAGSRRLLSLCFLLALVIVMMQKSTDPRYVRQAFKALGVPLDSASTEQELNRVPPPAGTVPLPPPAGTVPLPPTTAGEHAAIAQSSAELWQLTCNDLVPRLLQDATATQIASLARSWFGTPPEHKNAATPPVERRAEAPLENSSLQDESTRRLEQLWDDFQQSSGQGDRLPTSPDSAQQAVSTQQAWSTQFERFRREWQQWWQELNQGVGPEASSVSEEFRRSITTYLDGRLVENTEDGTVWKSSEAVAFWRLLQRPAAPAAPQSLSQPPLANTLQLESTAGDLKGSQVRYRGSVHRAEQRQRINELSGTADNYWQLWMRGEDEASQPVTVYTLSPVAQHLTHAGSPSAAAATPIEVVGVVGKRLAYASESGVQVAPTLFASSLQLLETHSENNLKTAEPAAIRRDLLWAGLLGLLASGLVLIPILSNWKRRSTRRLPQSPASRPGNINVGAKSTDASRTPPPSTLGGWCILLLAQQLWLGGEAVQVHAEDLRTTASSQPAVSQSAGPAQQPTPTPTLGMPGPNGKPDRRQQAPPQASEGPPVDPVPPWGNSDASRLSALNSLARQKLEPIFSPKFAQEVETYLAGGNPPVPVGVLQTMRSLTQLGWQRVNNLPTLEFNGLENASASDRLEPQTIAGFVVSVSPVSLTEEQQSWYAVRNERLYHLQLEVVPDFLRTEPDSLLAGAARSNSGDRDEPQGSGEQPPKSSTTAAAQRVDVFCASVPSFWLGGGTLRQPARLRGLVWRHSEGQGAVDATGTQLPTCLFAAPPQWLLPQSVSQADLKPAIPPTLWELGEQGWDLAQTDLVRSRNQRGLQQDEASAFYSMLRIVRTETPPNAGPPTAGQPVEPRPDQLTPQNALAEPRDSLGERVRWRVRLVSCSIIPVSDPADRKALGKDQYFQIDGFVELGNQRILYAMPGSDLAENGDTEFVEFEGEFPITIVLSGGSDLVEAQRGTEGELSWDLGGYAWLEGRFYRLWSYHSEMLEQTQAAARQAAPLVVATKLTQATPPIRVTSAPIGWFGYGLAGATLCFLGVLLYFVFSPDASRRHRISPRKT